MDCLLINGCAIEKVGVVFPRSIGSKMDDKAARQDACREYQSSLEDLTFNSKPHINMLTILAEENLNFAKDIVAIIEAQISKAPSTEKLPVLYLVDSIVKNVGGEYLAVFAKNLNTSFICVFEKVDENTRKSLFKLRSTWDDVFPQKKLYALDVRVNSVDPAWPIKPLPPTVNASIHVNPKFLKQSEEVSSPPPVPSPQPAPAAPAPAPAAAPAPQPSPAVNQYSLTQEQLIRQQLLAKQKQLLELQQKKIELELEQTKAQLVGGFVLPTSTPVSSPATQNVTPKPACQPVPAVRPRIPPQSQPDPKLSTRDPRLNRNGPPAVSQSKEHPAGKKATTTGSPALTPEKPGRPDRARLPRKEVLEEKPKSKSPSPLAKGLQNKNKPLDAEIQKPAESIKKDPRMRKRTQDKPGEAKVEEPQEKKRSMDKKDKEEAVQGGDPQRSSKGKLVNGSVTKQSREDLADLRSGGNARTHARKRTRSRSRSRSPGASPKRKDRRSPKSRTRSTSLSPSHKASKPRRVRTDGQEHGKPGRDDRPNPKKNQSESRRTKRPAEDRHSEPRDPPRNHDGSNKESKDAPHRWRSGWEDKKHVKPPEDSHVKPGPPRHKAHGAPTRPAAPRTSKHRLSVDANLQIPEALNSASKKDLLRRASKRLESGEISEEDFLNMAHKIKHFFQYQEEKQHHSENWDDSSKFPKKQQQQQQLLTTPASGQTRAPDNMGAAELSYYEHKSKLRKTQVSRRVAGEDWEGEDILEEIEEARPGEKTGSGRSVGHLASHKYSRAARDRPGERRSKERDEPRLPPGPMIEEYNHGKEFLSLKSVPGLRFRRRADPRDTNDREWTSPLMERYDGREEKKSGYDAKRRYCPPADSRREGPPSSGTLVYRNCPSPAGLDPSAPHFERERLSPLHHRESAEGSPIARFESPNSEHSDDGPISLDLPPHPPKSILKGPVRGGPLSSVRQRSNSPGHTPPHDGGHPASRYDGTGHMGPSRAHPPGWYEGGGPAHYEDSIRFDGPHPQGPGRFEGGGPPHHGMLERCDVPHMACVPMRGADGTARFDGPSHPQPPGRFDGFIGQQPPGRFEGQGPGPAHFEHFNSMTPGPDSGPMGFQQQHPVCFDGAPNQMGPVRFEGPGPGHYDGPIPAGPRFDIPHQGGSQLYEPAPGQQGPMGFAPQHNLQASMGPMAPPMYENPIPPQQNFNMAPQCFPEPMNPQFPAGPMAFPAQPNLQQTGNFNMQPGAFSQQGPAPFYAVGVQPPVNGMNLNQPFLHQNPGPFAPQVVPAENHFGQVDVNELLSKLISNGIITPAQPDAGRSSGAETPAAAPTASPAVEEEEEDEVDEDVPDLTGFIVEDMKQRYESVVTKLYSGNQCCLCSMRFTASQTDMYADHLDWHFRQNHAGKVASKKITYRRWYHSLRDWVEFEEIADLEDRAKSQFFEKESEEEEQKNQAAAKEKEFQSVKATKDQVGELCEICQEPFETYWVEEEEDWFLKNAVRVDDKNFHPACFEDYKNSAYVEATPSPSKALADHPLSAFIKEEVEEGGASCSFAAVKQEVEPEADELPEVKKEEKDVLSEDVQSDQKA
ncbi:pre-mRNA cleavage complex 2 protein Pcf11 [Brachionichthys hirsutus]|uniref:pre-mRNA cleavage complex 2 protein Pcf11 n=1 Tax=Brachionichthys hirsutus TaxID=412623 RepID=UPI003604CE83